MSMRQFIKDNRAELDRIINAKHQYVTNDEQREQWILNDEGLYNWARSEGVRV